MIGASDGKSYEDSADHFLGRNIIEEDFDALKTPTKKPIQEPPKDRPGDVINHFPSTPFEKWWIKSYIGNEKPESVNSLDNRRNIQIQRILDEMKDPGPVDQQITPGERIKDPQGQGRDVRVSQNDDYDMDAFRKNNPDAIIAPGQHYPDTYKKPNHPTFSNESIYHGKEGAEGGKWEKQEDGTYSFTPGKTNLEHFTPQQLQEYFDRVEPGNKLKLSDLDKRTPPVLPILQRPDSNLTPLSPERPFKGSPIHPGPGLLIQPEQYGKKLSGDIIDKTQLFKEKQWLNDEGSNRQIRPTPAPVIRINPYLWDKAPKLKG